MRRPDTAIAEVEWESLPPTIQRKYFTSLERLRFAHDAHAGLPSPISVHAQHTKSLRSIHSQTWHSQRSLSSRPSTSRTISSGERNYSVSSSAFDRTSADRVTRSRSRHYSPYSLQAQQQSQQAPRPALYLRSKQSQTRLSSPAIDIDPSKFTNLSTAARRRLFSGEEQALLTSCTTPFIFDAADEAIARKSREPRSLVNTSSYPLHHPYQADWALVGEPDDDDMNAQDLANMQWLDQDPNLDLRLDDYHAVNAEINSKKRSGSFSRGLSFRRGLSFSNVSFRRRSSSSLSFVPIGSTPNKPPALNIADANHKRVDSSSSVVDHYLDPSAKAKLRVYLASDAKFEEALEFGFPTMQRDATRSGVRPSTSPATPAFDSDQTRTFFADDTPSLSEDGIDRSDTPYVDGPLTPIDAQFGGRRSTKTSTDGHRRPRIVPALCDNYTQASAWDREMTLKISLTRPELRALEQVEHPQAPLVNHEPLEKPSLDIRGGPASRSIWDELPPEPSRMKRLFKRLKGK